MNFFTAFLCASPVGLALPSVISGIVNIPPMALLSEPQYVLGMLAIWLLTACLFNVFAPLPRRSS